MRIIKLGKGEFENVDEVQDFFQSELFKRKPEGQFRLPSNLIAENGLSIGEPILFSYKTIVCFTAIAKTGRLDNHDELADDYPYYFVIDMSSVQPAKISLEEIENSLGDELGGKSLVTARNWVKIPDSPITNELWESLRK